MSDTSAIYDGLYANPVLVGDLTLAANPELVGDLSLAANPFVKTCENLTSMSPPAMLRRCYTVLDSVEAPQSFANMKHWLDLSRAFAFGGASLHKALVEIDDLPPGHPGRSSDFLNILSYVDRWQNSWPWKLIVSLGGILAFLALFYVVVTIVSPGFRTDVKETTPKLVDKDPMSSIVSKVLYGFVILSTTAFGIASLVYMYQARAVGFTNDLVRSVVESNAIIQYGENGLLKTGARMAFMGNMWGAQNTYQTSDFQLKDSQLPLGETHLPFPPVFEPARYSESLAVAAIRQPFDKTFNWTPIAERFGTRGYYVNEAIGFLTTDEFRGAHADYNGHALICDQARCGFVDEAGQDAITMIADRTMTIDDLRAAKYLWGMTNPHMQGPLPMTALSGRAKICFDFVEEVDAVKGPLCLDWDVAFEFIADPDGRIVDIMEDFTVEGDEVDVNSDRIARPPIPPVEGRRVLVNKGVELPKELFRPVVKVLCDQTTVTCYDMPIDEAAAAITVEHPGGIVPSMVNALYQQNIYEDIISGFAVNEVAPIVRAMASDAMRGASDDFGEQQAIFVEHLSSLCRANDGIEPTKNMCQEAFGNRCGRIAYEFGGRNDIKHAYLPLFLAAEEPGSIIGNGGAIHPIGGFGWSQENYNICDVIQFARRPRAKDGSKMSVQNWVQFFRGKPNYYKQGEWGPEIAANQDTYEDFYRPSADATVNGSYYYREDGQNASMITATTAANGAFTQYLNFARQLDEKVIASNEQYDSLGRQWPEYYEYIHILADAVYDLNNAANKLASFFDWVVGKGDTVVYPTYTLETEGTTANTLLKALPIVFTVFLILSIAGQVCVALFMYFRRGNDKVRKIDTDKRAIVKYGLCGHLTLQGIFFMVCLVVGCLMVFVTVEVGAFCTMGDFSYFLLGKSVLPPLVDDLLPNKQIAGCIFNAEPIYEVGYTYPESYREIMRSFEDLVLPDLPDIGMTMIPNLSGIIYSGYRFWKLSTTSIRLQQVGEDVGDAKAKLQKLLDSEAELVGIAHLRGVVKGQQSDNYVVTSSTYEAYISSMTAYELLVVNLQDSGTYRDLDPLVTDLLVKALEDQGNAAVEVQHMERMSVLLGNETKIYVDEEGTANDDAKGVSYGDYIDPESALGIALSLSPGTPGKKALIDVNKKQEYSEKFKDSSGAAKLLPNMFEAVRQNYQTAIAILMEEERAESWDEAAHRYLVRLFGGVDELKKPIGDRKFCISSPTAKAQLQDICVLAYRPFPFIAPEGYSELKEGEEKSLLGMRKMYLVPVAGHCVYDVIDGYEAARRYWHDKCFDYQRYKRYLGVDEDKVAQELAKPYSCIQPMQETSTNDELTTPLHKILGEIAMSAIPYMSEVPDLLWTPGEAGHIKMQKRHSGLLPLVWDDGSFGRDPHWFEPVLPFAAAEGVTKTSAAGSYIFWQYHGYKRIPQNVTASTMALDGFKSAPVFYPYRSCILGGDSIFPIEDEMNMVEVEAFQFSAQYVKLAEFMASIQQIQTYNSYVQAEQGRVAGNDAISYIERQYKKRDVDSLPDALSLGREYSEILTDVKTALDRYLDETQIFNEVAQCETTTAVLSEATEQICYSGLGHASAIGWCILFMACNWFIYISIHSLDVAWFFLIGNRSIQSSSSKSSYHSTVGNQRYGQIVELGCRSFAVVEDLKEQPTRKSYRETGKSFISAFK